MTKENYLILFEKITMKKVNKYFIWIVCHKKKTWWLGEVFCVLNGIRNEREKHWLEKDLVSYYFFESQKESCIGTFGVDLYQQNLHKIFLFINKLN